MNCPGSVVPAGAYSGSQSMILLPGYHVDVCWLMYVQVYLDGDGASETSLQQHPEPYPVETLLISEAAEKNAQTTLRLRVCLDV